MKQKLAAVEERLAYKQRQLNEVEKKDVMMRLSRELEKRLEYYLSPVDLSKLSSVAKRFKLEPGQLEKAFIKNYGKIGKRIEVKGGYIERGSVLATSKSNGNIIIGLELPYDNEDGDEDEYIAKDTTNFINDNEIFKRILKRGDRIHNILLKDQYRSGPYLFWDGEKCINVNYDYHDDGVIPEQFKTFTEFPFYYFRYGGYIKIEFTDLSMHIPKLENAIKVEGPTGTIDVIEVTKNNNGIDEKFIIAILTEELNNGVEDRLNEGWYYRGGPENVEIVDMFRLHDIFPEQHKYYDIIKKHNIMYFF